MGKNPSGTKHFRFSVGSEDNDGLLVPTGRLVDVDAKHSDTAPVIRAKFVIEKGFIKSVTFPQVSDSMEQAEAFIDDFLEHFGVKGMKWGVRKKRSGSSSPGSADAQRAGDAKGKIKKGGTKDLSNDELQALVKRMELEQKYGSLNARSSKKAAGKKFVAEILVQVAKQEAAKGLGNAARLAVKTATG
jgi:hypothetical protein